MPRYLLSEHAYVRETGGHAVFLDLKRNKYTAVDADDLRCLRPLVHGWPLPAGERDATTVPKDPRCTDMLRLLLEEGVLTEDSRFGKDAVPVAIAPVTETIDRVRGAYPRITWRDFWSFIRAWALISVILRVLPLSWIVSRVHKRKARLRPTSAPFDARRAHRLMTAYWILRPNFFESKDACLRDSLTFVEFFAFYGMYPTLVFGVKMQPFVAHAWVQEDTMVLNDYIPHVTQFAPILVV